MKVLGIETSCDETGIAIYDSSSGKVDHVLYSQISLHAEYGGVVPELASRDHVLRLVPMLRKLLSVADVDPVSLDGVGYTAGPGLLGALMTGASFARSLAFGWGIPAVAVHHMEGHLLAPMLEDAPPAFPFVALLVSGGHSQFFSVTGLGRYELLGESLDDAVGEAFDKVGKMLGLHYPGGPAVAAAAKNGSRTRFEFPRPMVGVSGLSMSFSGLKTAVMNVVNQMGGVDHLSSQDIADISAGFEQAAIDTLVIKSRRALSQTGLKRLVVAGGVSANVHLRKQIKKLGDELGVEVYFPRPEWSTDNGAMIAYAAFCRLSRADATTDLAIDLRPRWPLVSEGGR